MWLLVVDNPMATGNRDDENDQDIFTPRRLSPSQELIPGLPNHAARSKHYP